MSRVNEREKLLAEVRTLPPGEKALEKLAFIRKEYELSVPGYLRALKILSDTMYQSRKHFLLELIQNADDSKFGSNEAELTLIIHEDGLELQYNEKGFTLDDVIAITETGASTKASKKHGAKSFIGEKGIGFKSVFALASDVEIESYPWHFRLSKDTVVLPKVVRSGTLREGDGTRMKVRFTDPSSIGVVAKELEKFVSGYVESFLFLQRLSRFHVEDRRVTPVKRKSVSLEPSDRSGETVHLVTSDGRSREYLQYGEDLLFPAELVTERWERMAASPAPLKRRMTVSVLVGEPIHRAEGHLFCYLPTEVKLPIPIFLQVDGHTKADRESLLDIQDNRWNVHLIQHLPEFLVRALLEWRKHPKISEELYRFVPVEEGTGQLVPVFKTMTGLLQKEEWVRTFDATGRNGWVTPGQAVVADEFLIRWFQDRPSFRKKAEELLGKKFVHPDWVKAAPWKSLAARYQIPVMHSLQFAKILEGVKLPSEMLSREENLLELYKKMLVHLSKRGIYAQEIQERLLCAPIFPVDRKFGPLQVEENSKAYWVSTRSRRLTGLESAVSIRIVDPKYTYRPDLGKERTPEKVMESERNEVVRDLLRRLNVDELNEDTLLVDLQIPWLSSAKRFAEVDGDVSYQVFFSIFEVFRAKRQYDDEYVKQLSGLSKAVLVGNSGKRLQLSQLLLPSVLRLFPEDSLYEESGLQELTLPDYWLEPPVSKSKTVHREREEERKRKWLEELRKFLILCGVTAVPRFLIRNKHYTNTSDFHQNDLVRSKQWRKLVGQEYTLHNHVDLEYVAVDDATCSVLESGQFDQLLMANAFYKAWLNEYGGSKKLFDTQTLYYSSQPPLGFFKVSYKRFDDRSVLLPDLVWLSKWSSASLLTLFRGGVSSPKDALRIRVPGRLKISKAAEYLPLVLESEEPEAGYHPDFLDSLDVKRLSLSHVNHLWQQVESDRFDDLIEVIIELLKAGVEANGLKLFDKKSKALRDASEFRLGHAVRDDVPSIEEQYGEKGRVLGVLLRLNVESEVTHYLEVLRRSLFDLSLNQEEQNQFEQESVHLLRRWSEWGIEKRREFNGKFQLMLEMNSSEAPIFLFDKKKARAMQKAGYRTLVLSVRVSDKQLFQDAAKEIGFRSTLDIGCWKLVGEQGLDLAEKRKVGHLIKSYLTHLEANEKRRLAMRLSFVQDLAAVGERIKKVERAVRVIDKVGETEIELPYLDLQEHLLLVKPSETAVEMVARLFSLSEFTTYRSALLELKEIEELLLKEAVKTNKAARSEQKVPIDEGPPGPKIMGKEAVAKELANSVYEERPAPETVLAREWRTGISPEQEQELGENLRQELDGSLLDGPKWREKKTRESKSQYDREGEGSTGAWHDPGAPDPKEFLLGEYQGKCQICATELNLSNGKKWIEIFRLRESRGDEIHWVNRQFNILGLCPNCHALAKHGGGLDLRSILKLAEEKFYERAFPVEVPKYHGDYYVTSILHNGLEKELVFSKTHLAHFVSALEPNFAEVSAALEDDVDE